MNMNEKLRAIILIFVEGIVVYFVLSYLVIGPLFSRFYVGAPASNEVPFFTSYVSLGMAVAYVTIVLTIYPAIKYRDGGEVNEKQDVV